MTHEIAAAVERLSRYNAWRRGEGEWGYKTFDDLALSPNQIGDSIESVLAALNEADASARYLCLAAQDAYDLSVNTTTYPDGPNLDRDTRETLKSAILAEIARRNHN